MGAELVLRDDGSTVFGLELKTDSVKDGVRVSAEMTGTVDGLECPNAEGQVPITVKLRLGGESAGIGYTQDLTVFIRTTVDDNAEIATTTFDVVQGTRQVSNGRDIYVESGESLQYNGNDVAGGKMSNTRLIQNTGNVTREDVSDLSGQGHNAAYRMAQTILTMTKSKWQNGGCVMIKADSPGKVEVGSTTQVPVNVIHKFGGAEVPSKLEVTLEGGESVNPTLIPRTAGTLTYLAPSETGKTRPLNSRQVPVAVAPLSN
jgi:hypothetical protein